jgi:hypothetical protein
VRSVECAARFVEQLGEQTGCGGDAREFNVALKAP